MSSRSLEEEPRGIEPFYANGRTASEEALRAGEERYRALFTLIDEGFAVIEVLYDETGAPYNLRFVETNPAFEKLTGLTDPVGKTSRELIPNLEDSCIQAYAGVVESGESIRFESYSHDFERWLDIFASRVGGEGSHLVNVVVDDITDRKLAESALRENEERSRLFFENVHEYALVRLDKELRFASWNPGAERIFGYSPQEVLGQPFSLLLSEEDRSTGIPCLELANIEKNGRTEDARWLIHKDGNRIWTRWVTEPIRDKDGQVSGWAKVLRDETERLKRETSLRESEKLAVVGRMASSIAHEINNPLEAVTNLIYLARNCEISSQAAALLRQAEHELARVSHIATATLHFHRQTSEPVEVNVEEILESTLLLHEGRLRATNVVTERRYSGHATIYCLANEIRQVFANLVSNAIDAMSKNTGPRRLIVRIVKAVDPKSGESGVRVVIADTGSGIRESAREHIFEPFFTTKTATGTGLGLWISAESVRKHHGTLRFRSRTAGRYRGTIFTVFLGRAIR
jgi:PAS domain S-box-containing protein